MVGGYYYTIANFYHLVVVCYHPMASWYCSMVFCYHLMAFCYHLEVAMLLGSSIFLPPKGSYATLWKHSATTQRKLCYHIIARCYQVVAGSNACYHSIAFYYNLEVLCYLLTTNFLQIVVVYVQ